jgi:hypothetical protein
VALLSFGGLPRWRFSVVMGQLWYIQKILAMSDFGCIICIYIKYTQGEVEMDAIIKGSVTGIEKSIKSLAKTFATHGIDVSFDTFRTGPGGDLHYGRSYVDIMVEGPRLTDDVKAEDHEDEYLSIRVYCSTVASSDVKWSDIKNRIRKEFQFSHDAESAAKVH